MKQPRKLKELWKKNSKHGILHVPTFEQVHNAICTIQFFFKRTQKFTTFSTDLIASKGMCNACIVVQQFSFKGLCDPLESFLVQTLLTHIGNI